MTDVDTEPHTPPVLPAALRRLARRVRPWHLNVVVTMAFVGVVGIWAVAVPLFEAPDERQHVEMIEFRAAGESWPTYNRFWTLPSTLDECEIRAPSSWTCPGPSKPKSTARVVTPLLAGDAPDRANLATFDELGGTETSRSRGRNQMLQHPTLYYEVTAKALQLQRALTGDLSFAGDVAFLRMLSVLIMAPVPVLCWWASRRFGASQRTAFLASIIPFTIPQFTHMGGVVNNDVLLITLSSVVIALLAGVVRGDRSWWTAGGIGVAVAAAMLTKTSSVVLIPVVAAAYVVGWVRSEREDTLGWAARLGLAGFVTAAGSGWWYVLNLSRHGSLTPSIHSEQLANMEPPAGWEPDIAHFVETLTDRIQSRFWGSFGAFSVPMDRHLILWSTVFALVVLVAAFGFRERPEDRQIRSGGWRWAALGVLAAPVLLLLVVVVVRSWRIYQSAGALVFQQGRYLFPGIAGMCVLAALGLHRIGGRWAPLSTVAWAAFVQADGLRAVLHAYWGGPGASLADRVHTVLQWSPASPASVKAWLITSVVAAALVPLAAVLTAFGDTVEEARSPEEPLVTTP